MQIFIRLIKILSLVGGILLLVAIVYVSLSRTAEMPFEQKTWLNGTNGNQMYFPRLTMADDLIETKKLDGLSRNQVVELLGEPSMENIQWSKDDYFGLVYHLGPERGFMSVDSEWLGISFGGNNVVKYYKLVRD